MSATVSTTTQPADASAAERSAEWGKIAISLVALGAFIAAMIIAWLTKSDKTFDLLSGVAATNATAVVSFWVGSSYGSQKKDNALIAQATGAPPPGTTTSTSTTSSTVQQAPPAATP